MADRRHINQKTGEVIEDVEPRPFHEFIKELGEGTTNSELSDGLWFRFQLRDGVLQLGVKLAEPEKSLEDAFAQIVDEVSLSVPTHVHYGRG